MNGLSVCLAAISSISIACVIFAWLISDHPSKTAFQMALHCAAGRCRWRSPRDYLAKNESTGS
jgi:hypothetical protein